MLLLSKVLAVDEERVCCEAVVSPGMPLLDEKGNLPGWVGIELMAQTVAAWGGRQARSEDREVGIGLLLGSRKYHATLHTFPAGARLIIDAKKIVRDGNMGVFHCTISLDGSTVAEAQLNTYMPDNQELQEILGRR
jgi:predicted hotdog family 3-hydroxylacyl-ACP dehydratase